MFLLFLLRKEEILSDGYHTSYIKYQTDSEALSQMSLLSGRSILVQVDLEKCKKLLPGRLDPRV